MIQLIIIIVFIILILYRIRNTEKYETNKEPFFTLWVPGKKGYEKQQPAHIKNGKVVPPKTIQYKYDYNTIYIEIVDYDKGLIKEIEYKSPKPYLVTTTHNEYILPVNYSDEFKDYMNKKVVIKFYRDGKNPDNFFHVTHVTLPKSKDSESSNISNLELDDYKPKKSVQDCIGSWNVIKKNIKKRGNLSIRTDDWEYKHTKNAEEGGKACPYENGKRISVKYSDIVSHKAPFRDPNINTKLLTSPNYIFDEIDKPERVAYLLSKGAYVHPMDRPPSQPSPSPPPPSSSPPPPSSGTKNCKVEFCTAYVDKDKENNGFEVNECKELYSKHKNEVTMYNQLYKNKDPRISDPSKQNAIWEDSKYKYTKFKYTVISLDTNAKNGCNGYIKLKKNSHPDYVEMNKFIEKNLKVGDTKTFIVKLINEKYIDKMVEDKKIDKIQGKILKDKYTKMPDKQGYAYLNTYMPFMIKLFINPSYIANEFDKWENDNKSYFGKCDNNGGIIWKKENTPRTININPVYNSRSQGAFSCPESVKYCSPDKNEWKYNVQTWKEGTKNDMNKPASGSKGCYVNPKAESLLKPKRIWVYYPYKKHDNMENMDLDPNTNTNLLQDSKYYWKKHMDIVTPKKSDKDCKAELQKPKGNRWTWSVPSPSGPGQINNKNMNWVDEIEWKYVVTNPGKDGGDKDHCFYNIPNSAHGLKDGDKIKIKTTNLAKYYKDVPKGLEWGEIATDGTSSRYIRDPNYFHELIKNPNYWVDKFNVVGRMKMGKPVYKEYF